MLMADAADQYAESINQATRSLLPDEVLHGEPMQCIVLALIALLVGTTSSLRREGCDVAPHGVTPPPTHQSYLTPLIETTDSARCRFKLPYNELIATTYDSAAAPASPPTPSSAWSPGSQPQDSPIGRSNCFPSSPAEEEGVTPEQDTLRSGCCMATTSPFVVVTGDRGPTTITEGAIPGPKAGTDRASAGRRTAASVRRPWAAAASPTPACGDGARTARLAYCWP